jgi:hypothetical protein
MNWPNNKDFAFTIIDDTDNSTVSNVKPIYNLLADLGLKTTKTVWGRFNHQMQLSYLQNYKIYF